MDMDYDAFIVGTGVAGSSLAYKLRAAGMKVGIADKTDFGGICAHHGCIPKKILSGAAEIVDGGRRMKGKGVSCDPKLQWTDIIRFKDQLVHSFTDPKEAAFKKAGVDTYHGMVSFHDHNTLLVGDKLVSAKHILLAIGATSRKIDIPGAEYLTTSDEYLDLKELPDKIIFAGGGYISFEFAHIAARAGADVTIIHRGENLLKNFDPDLVRILLDASEKAGIKIITGQELREVRQKQKKNLKADVCDTELEIITYSKKLESEVIHNCNMVVHGLGRVPDIDGLEAEKAGVAIENGAIAVNEYLQSISNPSVYAAGDCIRPGPALTPTASLQANVVASNIIEGNKYTVDYSGIASAVFTIPTLAAVGLMEKDTNENHKVLFNDLSKLYSARRTNLGYSASKVIIEKDTEKIVGAHVIGPGADDTINIFTLAVKSGLTLSQVREAMYAYPANSYDVKYMLK
ncbi:dihydrolipoyl dehydrogenase family protein [Methanolobus bombayensis]|uniref:dihydrolipoyl dehydrogenase family protein n=1 Tax=Methanolobus bombayensis TaxID=38023 RepID=UPI001AE1DD67|nr:NAD(P)/FAD-dependent oxidoreductase [Methanolobus bombayensis]MBP1910166.1 glutathione reductase (NADPH) [Methanolobus bombayensis]